MYWTDGSYALLHEVHITALMQYDIYDINTGTLHQINTTPYPVCTGYPFWGPYWCPCAGADVLLIHCITPLYSVTLFLSL